MRLAAGETLADLTLSQEAIASRGAALQCRITTEDTVNGFRPDTGRIAVHRSPGDAGIRLDGGTQVGAEVSAHFDSMLVKMTCRGRDFATAVVGAVASAKSEQELSHEDEAVLAQPGGKRQAALNRLLFPGPSKDFEDHREKYSETAQLSDNRLFYALRHGEEHRVELEKGVELLIGLEAISDPDERGMRTVMCIMNGRLRPVAVRDRYIASGVHRMLLRSCCLRPDKSSLGRSDIRHALLVTRRIRFRRIQHRCRPQSLRMRSGPVCSADASTATLDRDWGMFATTGPRDPLTRLGGFCSIFAWDHWIVRMQRRDERRNTSPHCERR